MESLKLKEYNLPDCLSSFDKWAKTVKELNSPKKFADFIQDVLLETYKTDAEVIKMFVIIKVLTRDLVMKHENDKFLLCLELYQSVLKQFDIADQLRAAYKEDAEKDESEKIVGNNTSTGSETMDVNNLGEEEDDVPM